MMNRAELQQLAEDRVVDAEALLAARRWSAAFYLAGYALECGLKSCVLAQLVKHTEVVFQDKKFSADCWTHSIDKLVALAQLTAQLAADRRANAMLDQNWTIVASWNGVSRYEQKLQGEAEGLFNAITDATVGVRPWIRTRW